MFKNIHQLNKCVHREKQSIVLNLFLFGPSGCGRNTFLHWIVQNENLLDANFLKAIESEQEQVRTHINSYMKALKDLPGILKQSLHNYIENGSYDEARTFFEISSYRIHELCKAYDGEMDRIINKSILHIQKSAQSVVKENQAFSYIDIVGSNPNIIYRIYYYNYFTPTPIELNNFLPEIDGLIYIWDSQQRIEENIEKFDLILDNLPPNTQTPLVIALNKVDLPHNINTADIHQLLSQARYETKLQTTLFTDAIFRELTIFETVATTGINTKSLINNLVRMIVLKNQKEILRLQDLLLQEAQS